MLWGECPFPQPLNHTCSLACTLITRHELKAVLHPGVDFLWSILVCQPFVSSRHCSLWFLTTALMWWAYLCVFCYKLRQLLPVWMCCCRIIDTEWHPSQAVNFFRFRLCRWCGTGSLSDEQGLYFHISGFIGELIMHNVVITSVENFKNLENARNGNKVG